MIIPFTRQFQQTLKRLTQKTERIGGQRVRISKYQPHQGAREKARRLRQLQASTRNEQPTTDNNLRP